jgi:hypothetical protein
MVFSFVALYWFVVESLSWGPLVVLLVLSESPQKAEVHDCYFTNFKTNGAKSFFYFLNLKFN